MKRPTPEQIPDNWSHLAGGLEEMAHFDISTGFYAAEALRLAGGVRPGERVLDVATGTGVVSVRAAEAGADVVAIDFAPGMVAYVQRLARERGLDNLDARVMDGQALELDDKSFDAAFSVFGVILFPDRRAGLQEIRRVVVPGGRVAFVSWAPPEQIAAYRIGTAALKRAFPSLYLGSQPMTWAELSDPELLWREIVDNGFRDVEIQSVYHNVSLPSPEWVWDHFEGLFPGLGFNFHRFDEHQLARLREALIHILRTDHGDGPLELGDGANIVTAVV